MMKRWTRSILLLGVFLSVPLIGTAQRPALTSADEPVPHIGDLVVQFGQLEYNCGDGCSLAGEPSDRIEFIDPRFGELVTYWETGIQEVRAMDAANGNGVLLGTDATPALGGVNLYAVRLAAEDGTVDETWGVDSPAELWPSGIVETPEDGDPILGEYDLLEATGPTGFREIDVPLLYMSPVALGATAGTVVYATGESTISPGRQLRLANRSTGSLIETVPVHQFRDAHMTPDGGGVVLTPGATTTAQFIDFDDVTRGVDYEVPSEEPLCDPVAVDAGKDRVYVLTVCAEEYGAQIHEFDRKSGRWLGTVKTWSGETLSGLDAYPLRMRVYGSFSPSETRIIYVHGASKRANLSSHLKPLRDSISLNYGPYASFNDFNYWQDLRICEEDPAPDPEPNFGPFTALPELEQTPDDDLPVEGHAGGTWNSPCDSESAIAENVLLLHEAIKTAYTQTGRPVILIGVSMGAAIIRGVFTYSTLLEDDVASKMIDTVIFVAGAHDGSPDAACATGACRAVPELELIYRILADFAFDLNRPAIHDLSANSTWYDWANDARAPLPAGVGYYNFYADIDAQRCTINVFGCWNHSPISVGQWGDGVLNVGTNNPHDTPDSGGASFSRENTVEQWQYQIFGPNDNKVREDATDITHEEARVYPAYHARIIWHTQELTVDSCDGGRTTVARQLEFIVLAQLGLGLGPDGARACPLHEIP